jgi:hypothetical protein
MHTQSFRTDLENILELAEALYNAHGMESVHGVDSSEMKDNNGGSDSCGEDGYTSSTCDA